jgi:hypothetical protein
MTELRADEIEVRGNATTDEIAAVLATLSQRLAGRRPSRYEQWRAARIASLRIAQAH